MNVKTIGIDLAKNVFQIHGVDEHGKRLFNKQLRRAQMASFFANIPPCLIGMEACASAHFWANKLSKRGDTYLRTLLIHGARAVLQSAKHKQDAVSSWANQLMARRNNNIASVALANKNARTVWALLAKEREYCAPIISA
ncbi:hypothetical protein WCV28_18695 [Escherichia coli]|nr:transposase [Escherichia coli]